MPALSVSVDGKHVATICADGLDTLSFGARGTCIDERISDFDISGGSYPEGGDSRYLTWVSEAPLRAGQVVIVSLLESAVSTLHGKTIDEMFPDDPPNNQTDFSITAEMYRELRARSRFREKFAFRFESSLGTIFVGETAPETHGFGFSVHWNSSQPRHARVSLHSYSLDSLETHGPMNKHVEERIYFGDSVRFELVA